jgi:hypothetical protein
MRVIQVGNFEPEHSTENHLLTALRANGHDVRPMQENDPQTFSSLAHQPDVLKWADFVLWTRTGWDWDRVYPGGETKAHADQRRMLRRARDWNIPVVGYHLDIWFGLNRAHQVDTEPFFESNIVITADGGHEREWAERAINHVWMPPGVSAPECEPGRFDAELHSKLAFVGSWQGHYHEEHQHRFELVNWLKANYRQHCEFYPRLGQPAVRGEKLRDLYASVDVLVGDSCFAGQGLENYWSDRIPETLGRGGVLLHPDVPGLSQAFHGWGPFTWAAGDWNALGELVERTLAADPRYAKDFRETRRREVLAHHTHEVRMSEVVELLQARSLL